MSSRAVALAVLAVAGIVRACYAVPVEAQASDALVSDVVRLAFHESVDPYADAPGIHAVLLNGAARRGVSPHAYARSHSPRFFAGTSARPWALAITLTCERPRGYAGSWTLPRGDRPSWQTVCLATVAHVRALREPACEAETWGSHADYAGGRFAAEHARDVFCDCGPGARNLFSRPRRGVE